MTNIKQKVLLDIVSKAYLFSDITKTAEIPYNLLKIENKDSRISATCSNTGIVVNFSADSGIEEYFSFVVNAYKFFDIVKNWNVSEEINFQISDTKIVLKAKNKRVTVACVQDEGYWASRGAYSDRGFVCSYQDIKTVAETVSFCSSKTAFDITHRCTLIESLPESKILFASHEGFRLASLVVENSTVVGSFRVLVEADSLRSAIRVLDASEDIHIGISDNRVDIFNSKAWLGIATVPAKYPDVFKVRNMRYPYTYLLDSRELLAISKSVLSVLRNSDKPRNARVSIGESSIQFYAATEDGDIEDSLPFTPVNGGLVDHVKGCDIVYFSEPAELFKKIIFETGPDKKHGYVFTSEEIPGWTYHLLATR